MGETVHDGEVPYLAVLAANRFGAVGIITVGLENN